MIGSQMIRESVISGFTPEIKDETVNEFCNIISAQEPKNPIIWINTLFKECLEHDGGHIFRKYQELPFMKDVLLKLLGNNDGILKLHMLELLIIAIDRHLRRLPEEQYKNLSLEIKTITANLPKKAELLTIIRKNIPLSDPMRRPAKFGIIGLMMLSFIFGAYGTALDVGLIPREDNSLMAKGLGEGLLGTALLCVLALLWDPIKNRSAHKAVKDAYYELKVLEGIIKLPKSEEPSAHVQLSILSPPREGAANVHNVHKVEYKRLVNA